MSVSLSSPVPPVGSRFLFVTSVSVGFHVPCLSSDAYILGCLCHFTLPLHKSTQSFSASESGLALLPIVNQASSPWTPSSLRGGKCTGFGARQTLPLSSCEILSRALRLLGFLLCRMGMIISALPCHRILSLCYLLRFYVGL